MRRCVQAALEYLKGKVMPEQTGFEALTGNCRRVETPRAQLQLGSLGKYVLTPYHGIDFTSRDPANSPPILILVTFSPFLYTFTHVATEPFDSDIPSQQSPIVSHTSRSLPSRRPPSHLHHLRDLFVAAPLSFRYPLSSRCWTPRTTSTTSCS